MKNFIKISLFFSSLALALSLVVLNPSKAVASSSSSSSIGLEGTLSGPPPSQAATISSPANGSVFSSIPISVSGSCPNNLLIEIFSNGVFVGATQCSGGSYSIPVDLFSGTNILVAKDFDNLNQEGPDSNSVSVTFNNPHGSNLGALLSLSSTFGKKGVNPGQQLSWPISVSGGTTPITLTVDWGDGQAPSVLTLNSDGTFNVTHTYISAGTYNVIVKASDKSGQEAFLQLVAVANGPAQVSNSTATGTTGGNNAPIIVTNNNIIWWPLLIFIPLMIITFIVGRRYELTYIRRHLEEAERSQSNE